MFPLAHMEPKVGVSRHPRGMLGEEHHVSVWYAQHRITDGIAVEAYGPKQVTLISTGGHSIGDLAHGPSKNRRNAEHEPSPELLPDRFLMHRVNLNWRKES
jgi:hypothetical protein